MILTRLGRDLKVGAEERGSELGDELLGGVARVAPAFNEGTRNELNAFRTTYPRSPRPCGGSPTSADTPVCAVDWEDHEPRMHRLLHRHYGHVDLRAAPRKSAARRAVEAYFNGDLAALDNLPTATNGTEFQRQVWDALRRIPVGRTVSYGALAAQIGRPSAMRAVGLANGQNPIAIVVPCHRVIGANADLTGYGGGLPRKRWLLGHEANGAIWPS